MDTIDEAEVVSQRFYNLELNKIKTEMEEEGAEFCEDCEEEIPAARRKAMPSCKTCVVCQEKREECETKYCI